MLFIPEFFTLPYGVNSDHISHTQWDSVLPFENKSSECNKRNTLDNLTGFSEDICGAQWWTDSKDVGGCGKPPMADIFLPHGHSCYF